MRRMAGPVRALAAAAALVALAAACSDDQSVGEGLDTGLKGKLNELSTTTQPAGPASTAVAIGVGQTTTTPTTAAPTTAATVRATTTTADNAVVVTINSDTSGRNQFEPNTVQARVGSRIRFTNADTKMRYVLSPDGGFRSPELQPGDSWVYVPTTVGTFQLKDGTRPYVTGTLQVY